jgi:Na+(H+)/acetate symporter ActP
VTISLAVVLIAYFAGVIALAIVGYRRTRTSADFIVAGRTLGALVGGATLAATQISAGTFVGTVGLHYLAGVSFVWIWPGAWLGWLVSAVFVAPRLRDAGTLTIPEYCEKRFDSRAVRALAAVLIVAAYTIYLVAQYKASGIIVSTVLGWPAWTGIALVLVSTVVYSLAGGLHGGARIDLLQSMVMVVGLVAAVPYLRVRRRVRIVPGGDTARGDAVHGHARPGHRALRDRRRVRLSVRDRVRDHDGGPLDAGAVPDAALGRSGELRDGGARAHAGRRRAPARGRLLRDHEHGQRHPAHWRGERRARSVRTFPEARGQRP